MPNKLIKQGYKIFALAERGYIWTFTRSSRFWGIVDLSRWRDISPTSSTVPEMIRRLPGLSGVISQASSYASGQSSDQTCAQTSGQTSGYIESYTFLASATSHAASHATSQSSGQSSGQTTPYTVYTVSYFSTVGLFKALRDIRCGACGTTRKSSGIPSYLAELKDHIKSIPWGKLYASEAEGVLCLLWQDNNITLLLSTIHWPYHYVKAERKRPAATSTNAAIARAPFGNNFKEELNIPKVINDYNRYMDGVGIANQ
jgi:hypothetical protein